MSEINPTPQPEYDPQDNFESIIGGVSLDTPDLQEAFTSLDKRREVERDSSIKEMSVVDYLADDIPDIAALGKMLESLKNTGIHYPTCDRVTTILEEMLQDDEYKNRPDEFLHEMMRMDKFAIIIEQLAQSQTREVVLTKDETINEIVLEELFEPEEREILVAATDFFLAAE